MSGELLKALDWWHSFYSSCFICYSCGFSQSPVRRFGTHCLVRCVIRPSSLKVLARDFKTHLFAVGH